MCEITLILEDGSRGEWESGWLGDEEEGNGGVGEELKGVGEWGRRQDVVQTKTLNFATNLARSGMILTVYKRIIRFVKMPCERGAFSHWSKRVRFDNTRHISRQCVKCKSIGHVTCKRRIMHNN